MGIEGESSGSERSPSRNWIENPVSQGLQRLAGTVSLGTGGRLLILMKTFLLHIWMRLRISFWFIPGLLVVLAGGAAYLALAVDRVWDGALTASFPQLTKVSGDGVRSVLSTAASSVLTLAGITFSSTLVALTLASSQYGGRLLRNFIRSLTNQISLGILLGNFVFCLIVLRSVRTGGSDDFIPHIAALSAFILTLGSLGAFIVFIHHIATSLQADNIVSTVYEELDEAIEQHFPDERPEGDKEEDEQASEEKIDWDDLEDEVPIPAPKSGYIQAIAFDTLVDRCKHLDLRCRVLHRAGHFVNAGTGLLATSGEKAKTLSEEDREALLDAYIIGRLRTAEQDSEFCIRQLVEVSLRALSPGINDPFTAMNCIDLLGAALAKIAQRKLPKRHFSDSDGAQRVRARPIIFDDLLDVAFHQIRQTAGSHTDIALRLLGALSGIGANVLVPNHAKAVLFHAELIAKRGRDGALAESDADLISEALQNVEDRLKTSPESE